MVKRLKYITVLNLRMWKKKKLKDQQKPEETIWKTHWKKKKNQKIGSVVALQHVHKFCKRRYFQRWDLGPLSWMWAGLGDPFLADRIWPTCGVCLPKLGHNRHYILLFALSRITQSGEASHHSSSPRKACVARNWGLPPPALLMCHLRHRNLSPSQAFRQLWLYLNSWE